MRNFSTKVDNATPDPSGELTAAEDNCRFNELELAVSTTGIALDGSMGPDTRFNMLAESMARYASGGIFCADTGTANTYLLGLVANFVAPTALFTGLEVEFYPGNSSSGASQINAFGLGLKKLFRPDGSAIQALDVVANKRTSARYDQTLDSGAGAFKMAPWALPINVGGGTVPISGEGVSVDSGVHTNLNYPGLSLITTLNDADLLAFYINAAGHHEAITWANVKTLLGITPPAPPPFTILQGSGGSNVNYGSAGVTANHTITTFAITTNGGIAWSAGVFTVPINGVYEFSATIYGNDNQGNTQFNIGEIAVSVNGTIKLRSAPRISYNGNTCSWSIYAILLLNLNDQVILNTWYDTITHNPQADANQVCLRKIRDLPS